MSRYDTLNTPRHSKLEDIKRAYGSNAIEMYSGKDTPPKIAE
jgi:hypothetical protein